MLTSPCFRAALCAGVLLAARSAAAATECERSAELVSEKLAVVTRRVGAATVIECERLFKASQGTSPETRDCASRIYAPSDTSGYYDDIDDVWATYDEWRFHKWCAEDGGCIAIRQQADGAIARLLFGGADDLC